MKTFLFSGTAFGAVALGFAAGWMLNSPGASRSFATPAQRARLAVAVPDVVPGSVVRSGANMPTPDFAARLGALAGVRDPFRRVRAIAAIGDELDAGQVREALVALEGQSLRDRDEVRLQLLARWAELDPQAALEYARNLPSGFIAPGAIAVVIKSWVATDAKAAEEAIETLPATFVKRVARAALIEALSESDPQRAFTILQQATPAAEAVLALFENWAGTNPEAATSHAALLPPGFLRDLALRTASGKFAEEDREGALAWAQSIPAHGAAGTSIERRNPRPLATVLHTWIGEDADAAMQWLEQLPDDAAKTDVLAALSRSLAKDDPQHATEVAAMMPAGKAQDGALRQLMGSWGAKDFAGALAWAQQQPDTGVRQILLPQLVDQLARRDTAAALELAATIGGEGGQRAVSSVLRAWTNKDPAEAAAWAREQPDNSIYFASIATEWAGKDQESAREWVGTLPAGPAKDDALSRGVQQIAQSDQPRIAEEWIVQISDEAKRAAAYKELAFWWLRADPKGARAWLGTAPLPAKVKADLVKAKAN